MGRDVLIAGGGIGGLTAAIALHRDGHQVRVLERAPAMGWGQGVQVSPPGMATLRALGLAEEVERTGQVIRHARKLTRDGLLLRERHFGRGAGFTEPHVAISRGALQVVLADQVRALGIPIELNCSLRHFEADDSQVRVTQVSDDVESESSCDLLIGADGIHSAVRKQLFSDDTPEYTGFVQFRGVIPLSEVSAEVESGVVSVFGDAHNFYSYYRMNETEISFGACINVGEDQHPEESWSSQGDPEELLETFEGFPGPLAELATGTPYLARMHIFDHATLPHWSTDRVTLLGDAAHAMLPFAGQATVTAIEDAATLARCLTDDAFVPVALERYQAERIPPVARIRDHCRDRGGIFEEYLVYEQLTSGDWADVDLEEQQDRLARIDWSDHDSFLRELY